MRGPGQGLPIKKRREDYTTRPVAWNIWIDGEEYFAVSQSEAAAVRKALTEHRTKHNHGRPLRLGQGVTTITFCRSHRRELNKWLAKGNRVLM